MSLLREKRGSGVLKDLKELNKVQMWGHKAVIPALGRLRQENTKFKDRVGCSIKTVSQNKAEKLPSADC